MLILASGVSELMSKEPLAFKFPFINKLIHFKLSLNP